MDNRPSRRHQTGRQIRLYLLALVCATAGALTVWRVDLVTGVVVYLLTTAILGSLLWAYERRRRAP